MDLFTTLWQSKEKNYVTRRYPMFNFFELNPVLSQLIFVFSTIFDHETRIVSFKLLLLAFSVIVIPGCFSISYSYNHFMNLFTDKKLNSFYHMINEAKMDLGRWEFNLIQIALQLLQENCPYPLLLIIDDTIVSKFGKKFQMVTNLYDHSSKNDDKYVNGHCFICLILGLPAFIFGKFYYIRIPVALRMWIPEKFCSESKKFKTKLQIADELLRQALQVIGSEILVVVLADSWYPKGSICQFIRDNKNVAGIFNVRVNTALYALPSKQEGKRGRPAKKGKKININEITLVDVPGTNYRVGYCDVITNLFGTDMVVRVMVTETKKTKTRRLFICTNPELCVVDLNVIAKKDLRAIGSTVSELICFGLYGYRWNIEVAFMELKRFWGLNEYRLMTADGIERLLNLQLIVYAVLCLMPYRDKAYECLHNCSIQERRFAVAKLIEHQQFLWGLIAALPNDEKDDNCAQLLRQLAQKMTVFFDKRTG